jgi:ABC-type sugar transport system ATPase subunit
VTEAPPVVEINDLTKRFGAVTALDHVNLTVGRGEIVALLGDNGAGKSTLIKCLCGVYRPDAGHINIGGVQADLTSPAQARKLGIGIVFQDLALFDNLSVCENLFAGSELRRPPFLGPMALIRRKEMLRKTQEIIDRLEVRIPNLRTPVGLLSGGQRQAIAVSRGVAFASQLVVLDEPTAALGLRERANVLQIVQRLPETGVSVILITHNLDDVISIASRAVVLRQGKQVGEVPATAENHERIVSMIVGGTSTTLTGAWKEQR